MKHLVSSSLEFGFINDVAEYEALLLGLQKSISLNMVMLKVVCDSNVVLQQVLNTIHSLSPHLKSYQEDVWRLISNFQAFNIIFVPCTRNAAANALANAASRMSLIRDRFTIEILYKPSILGNITNLRMFNDDQQILHFMANVDDFKDATIDDYEHECSLEEEVGDMKGHIITNGLASLEKLYDLQEHFQEPKNNKTHGSTMRHELINLGT